MDSAKDRLLLYLKSKKIGQSKCEEMAGISRGYIANNKGNIGATILNRLSSAFPDLNIDWLVNGIGEMLTDGTDCTDVSAHGGNVIAGDGNHHNHQYNGTEMAKDKEIEMLKSVIADKDEEIKFLRSLLQKQHGI